MIPKRLAKVIEDVRREYDDRAIREGEGIDRFLEEHASERFPAATPEEFTARAGTMLDGKLGKVLPILNAVMLLFEETSESAEAIVRELATAREELSGLTGLVWCLRNYERIQADYARGGLATVSELIGSHTDPLGTIH